jgi:predicted TIM-barrel fold metal-dependent hydrolase
MQSLQAIDFHHHARPASFWDALRARGRTDHAGVPFPPATEPEKTLRVMDSAGIAMALLSSPDADALCADRDFAVETCRPINEFYASLMRKWPDRFGGLVCLPLPHVDLALEEIRHGLDVLKLDGVLLCTSYLGDYIGNPTFDPVLEELDRRGTTVLVHPVSPIHMDKFKLKLPPYLAEFTVDTTRCIINCLTHNVAERFPKVKLVFSHAGGTAPYLAQRIALLQNMHKVDPEISIPQSRENVRAGLRRFWYDTALSAVDPVFNMLREIVGIDRVVFGSDFPQSSPDLVVETAKGVAESKVLSATEKACIARDTMLELMPHLAERISR